MSHLTKRTRSQTEAQAFHAEAYPFPVAAMAVLMLLIGDVAVTMAMLRAIA
jgi:hypothetical protein